MNELIKLLNDNNVDVRTLLELADLEISKLEVEKESIEIKIKGLRNERLTLVKAIVTHQSILKASREG
jgi:hypothetical protein